MPKTDPVQLSVSKASCLQHHAPNEMSAFVVIVRRFHKAIVLYHYTILSFGQWEQDVITLLVKDKVVDIRQLQQPFNTAYRQRQEY